MNAMDSSPFEGAPVLRDEGAPPIDPFAALEGFAVGEPAAGSTWDESPEGHDFTDELEFETEVELELLTGLVGGIEPELEAPAGGVAFPSGTVLRPASGATGEREEHWDPNGVGLPLLDTGPDVQHLRLAANFTVAELVSSGGRAASVARVSPALVQLLQGIRDRVGGPVRVSSGYRSWARNTEVYRSRGQEPTRSRHCSGQAADISATGLSGTDLARLAIDAGGRDLGIGVGESFAHVDVRGAWALWTYLSGDAATRARENVIAHRDGSSSSYPPGFVGPVPGTDSPDRRAGVVRQTQATSCTGGPQPGARALGAQWTRLTGRRAGIYNCRANSANTARYSVHSEGRAIDAYADASDSTQRAQAEAYASWLIANAVELQVQYVIWNRRQWSWPKRAQGWRSYGGPSPHTDHLHIELSWEGARNPSPLFGGAVPGM